MSSLALNPQQSKGTTLSGRPLLFGRLLWLIATVLALLTLSEIWPENYTITYGEWVVTRTWPAVESFMRYGDFVRFVTWLESLTAVTSLLMGFLIIRYRSHDKMGLFVSAFLILAAPWFISSNMDTWHLPGWVPLAEPLLGFQAAATLSALLLIFYLFPDGRFVPRWTRWPAVLALVGIVLFMLYLLTPSFATRLWDGLGDIGWLLFSIPFVISMFVAAFGQFYRYRSTADPVQRQQMKWVVFGFGLYISTQALALFGLLGGPFEWGPVFELLVRMLAQWFIPLAIGFSILRYRLWDIDLLINRTLVYGGLTLLVAAVYILTVGLISSLFQSGGSILFSVLATGLIAILFNPLRQRLQTAVNRLMYGERDDPITVLTALGRWLEETAVPAETLPALVETIAQSLKLPYVAIAAGDDIIATSGPPPPARQQPLALPLVYQSETIGQLLVSPRAPGEGFTPAEMTLLQNVARQAGSAVYAAQLTADLQRSRERLVTTREEERRRIRRDLHDGLGPQLATLSLKVDAARNYLEQDTESANQLLMELKGEIQSAISDIRRLAHDLRPPALDQLGLVSALREFAGGQNGRSPIEITIDAPQELPPLPAAVEVAAYRIALEAMTNTARHAQARCCTVVLRINGGLYLEIKDDGRGLPAGYKAGVGLSSMRERTAELGGDFHIESVAGSGTAVTVTLPLG